MRYGEIIKLRWSPKLKWRIVLFLLVVFVIGIAVGFAVGRLSAPRAPQVVDKLDIEVPSLLPPVEPVVSVTDPVVSVVQPAVEPVLYYDVPLSEDLQDYIRKLCKENEVPMPLILAMIQVESSFRSDVISGTNDYGLMQINKINHEWLAEEYGITDFLDPYQSVLCGIKIIAEHLEKTDGNTTLALMRYNCGATGAKRLWEKGIYSTPYAEKILAAMEVYDEI